MLCSKCDVYLIGECGEEEEEVLKGVLEKRGVYKAGLERHKVFFSSSSILPI